ncbi:hypothetical protein Acsp02_55760 [Actinoplanes sp. NBRC 103695]|nr:hypothetical protein Acsp02_55760 [Actinoplanes sp. NBRC 103695]
MPAEIIGHMFEPFFATQRDGGGTGPGLATVYGIVTRPRPPSPSSPHPAPCGSAHQRGEGPHPGSADSDKGGQAMAKIVAADDNDAIQDVVTRVLNRAGHEVIMCHDGGELVDEVRSQHPEIVVTDNQMPVMTGLQARETLLEDPETADIPVVLASANATDSDTRQVLVDGDQQVPKPFTATQLNDGVDAALKHTRSRHASTHPTKEPHPETGTPQA